MSKYSHFEMCEKIFGSRYKFNKAKELVPYSRTDMWDKMIEQQDKIADLEAKLAESESKIKVGEFWHSAYQGKQLDYDKVYAELRQSYDENEKLKQQLAEKEKEIISLECVISEIHNDIKELHEFKVGEDEYDLTDSDARFSLGCELLNKYQDKIEFAIEQLEETRKLIANLDMPDSPVLYNNDMFQAGFDSHYVRTRQTIDNQINELKEIKGE